jgi:hypothetical protein
MSYIIYPNFEVGDLIRRIENGRLAYVSKINEPGLNFSVVRWLDSGEYSGFSFMDKTCWELVKSTTK